MKKYLSVFLLIVAVLMTGIYANRALAGDSTDDGSGGGSGGSGWVSGWAWASNIGWISFNFQDSGAGGTVPYFVQIDTSGNFSGYAWSSNIGWISFNSSSLTQSPSCPSASPAHVNPVTGAVTGWIRATAGIGRSDGWDGCIELSGSNHTSPDNGTVNIGGTLYKKGGVTYDTVTGIFDGFAWGGPVVGWLNFNPRVAGVNPVNCPPGTCPITNTNTIGGSCTMNGVSDLLTVDKGSNVTFSATPTGGTGPYTYSWGTGEGAYPSAPPSSNTFSHTYSSNGIFQTNVVATDSSGTFGTISCGTLNVRNPQGVSDINLYIGRGSNPAGATLRDIKVKKGNPFVLKWENSLLGQGYDCPVSVNPNVPSWTGWGRDAGNFKSFSVSGTSVNVGSTYTFTISCSKDPDFQSSSVTLKVVSSSLEEI